MEKGYFCIGDKEPPERRSIETRTLSFVKFNAIIITSLINGMIFIEVCC